MIISNIISDLLQSSVTLRQWLKKQLFVLFYVYTNNYERSVWFPFVLKNINY